MLLLNPSMPKTLSDDANFHKLRKKESVQAFGILIIALSHAVQPSAIICTAVLGEFLLDVSELFLAFICLKLPFYVYYKNPFLADLNYHMQVGTLSLEVQTLFLNYKVFLLNVLLSSVLLEITFHLLE